MGVVAPRDVLIVKRLTKMRSVKIWRKLVINSAGDAIIDKIKSTHQTHNIGNHN